MIMGKRLLTVMKTLSEDDPNGMSARALGKKLFPHYIDPKEGAQSALLHLERRKMIERVLISEDAPIVWRLTDLGRERVVIQREIEKLLHHCKFCVYGRRRSDCRKQHKNIDGSCVEWSERQ